MGKYSGYDILPNYFPMESSLAKVGISGNTCPSFPVFDKLISKYVSKYRKSLTYDRHGLWAELSAGWYSRKHQVDLIHTFYVESHFSKLPRLVSEKTILCATAHQPPSLWKTVRHNPELLDGLDCLIVLSSESLRYFEHFLPGRVHFIPHGVDVNFFSPPPGQSGEKKEFRCVFSGKWLRDLSALEKIIVGISKKNPQIKFDMIVPVHDRDDPCLLRLMKLDNLLWHAGLSDEQLRGVYRKASLLLLPLIDCTANNALLEGIACGLPVVSNEVGGMRDYTDESFAELLPVGDIRGCIDAVLSMSENQEQMRSRSARARQFAVENLSWPLVAKRTFELYSSMTHTD